MKLTDREIQFGFNYYFKDDDKLKSVVELSEYNGEEKLIINCTQLGYWIEQNPKKEKDKKRILNEWCDFLINNPDTFTELEFGTRMPQELFNAVCSQRRLKKLSIKWGAYKDISLIKNLSNIERLHLGSGAGVEDISPLTSLDSLIALSVENFQKITNYSSLSKLVNLKSLSVCGDGMGPQYIKVDSLKFLNEMKQLRFLKLLTIRLQSKDYTPVLNLTELEYLTLRTERNVKKIYSQLLELPKLKWGLLKERPEAYLK